MQTIKTLLVEDHGVVRAGIKMLLNAEEDIAVIGEADEGSMAVELALRLNPDVVVMDISMRGINGLEACRQISSSMPEISILILTMHQNDEYFFQALQAGALGYVPKSAPDHELLTAIRSVAQGQAYIHPSMAGLLINDYLQRRRENEGIDTFDGLTGREREILQLVASGYTNKEISEKLNLSVHTVHNHRSRIMEKLNLHDRMELLKYALKKGLLIIE